MWGDKLKEGGEKKRISNESERMPRHLEEWMRIYWVTEKWKDLVNAVLGGCQEMQRWHIFAPT